MARNKARRPGSPSGSASAGGGSLARPEATAEGDVRGIFASSRGSAAELPGAPAAPAAERLTDPGAEWQDAPALADAARASAAGEQASAGASAPGSRAVRPLAAKRGGAVRDHRSAGWRGIIGGLIGGGIVALLAYLLPQESPGLAEVRGQLDQLRQNVSQIEQPVSEGLPGSARGSGGGGCRRAGRARAAPGRRRHGERARRAHRLPGGAARHDRDRCRGRRRARARGHPRKRHRRPRDDRGAAPAGRRRAPAPPATTAVADLAARIDTPGGTPWAGPGSRRRGRGARQPARRRGAADRPPAGRRRRA